MDLPSALQLLARDPNLVAWRGRGVIIRMTEGHVIERVFIPRPHRWAAPYKDLVAMDWMAGTPADLEKFYKRMQEESAA